MRQYNKSDIFDIALTATTPSLARHDFHIAFRYRIVMVCTVCVNGLSLQALDFEIIHGNPVDNVPQHQKTSCIRNADFLFECVIYPISM